MARKRQGQGSKKMISVYNTGEGIPPEKQKAIFERFYRVDKARTREMGGTGLGLSIAKSLTEVQKGNLDIQIDGDLFKVLLKFPLSE